MVIELLSNVMSGCPKLEPLTVVCLKAAVFLFEF